MKWTTEKPTKTGWYFIKREFMQDAVVWIGKGLVCHAKDAGIIQSLEGFVRNNVGVEFSGPIPEPDNNIKCLWLEEREDWEDCGAIATGRDIKGIPYCGNHRKALLANFGHETFDIKEPDKQ